MSGFILDTAAAVGDIVVVCTSVSIEVVPIGPGHSKSRGEITGHNCSFKENPYNA